MGERCPCAGCEYRTSLPRCHTHCMRYKQWRAEHEKEMENLHKDLEALKEKESNYRHY